MKAIMWTTLAAVIAIALVSPIFGQQPPSRLPQKRSTTNTKISSKSSQNPKSTEQQAIDAVRDLIAQEVRIQQQNAEQSQAEKSEAKQNVAIQMELAKYTRGLFWVGLLQGFVLLVTAGILYRQIATTRTTERAWLSVEPLFNNMTEAPPEGAATVLYVCTVKNTGKTPARVVEAGLAIRRTNNLENLPAEPAYVAQEVHRAGQTLLVPGDEFALTALLQPPMTTAEWVSLRNRQTYLYTYGFIVYLDIFGDRREFRFCHSYHVPVPGEAQVEGFQRLVNPPPRYNMAT